MVKIFIGLIMIAVVVGVMAGGAFAYFSDTETSTGNTFSAGTLDLVVNDENPWAGAEFSLSNLVPGSAGYQDIELSNLGSIPGVVDFAITNLANDENDVWEPEAADGDTGAPGELGQYLSLTITADLDSDGIFETLVAYGSADTLSATPSSFVGGLAADGMIEVRIDWSVDYYASNIIQSDGCILDIVLNMSQS